jgi:hypothetical protein
MHRGRANVLCRSEVYERHSVKGQTGFLPVGTQPFQEAYLGIVVGKTFAALNAS